ncbi:acetolactate synthase [Lineolata rhizophorae]|uniref:Acetolactate synthase n=1 Tax=Lineolata rhizophorae TaxID=578093 RepID=A0A6A6NN39_9PEZI|nr:acetolactate synthase [Lineolata rhizophorae]
MTPVNGNSNGAAHTITGARAILRALEAAGITHLFVNLGSDHPAFLSAFVQQKTTESMLQIFTSPNEMNALSAASGFAQVTGKPAVVLVHVECGTQGLAGAVHNVSKGRIPVIIMAGTVPITQEGELKGSRNEYIHWIQDVPDQRAIVRQYMRYEHEIRNAVNATQIVFRALQFATSSPQGPTYLIAARETLEQEIADPFAAPLKPSQAFRKNGALETTGLMPDALDELASVLLAAERPLIVTSYCGRTAAGFAALQTVAELLSIAVHENAPIYNNFPTTSFLHQGHQWNGGGQLLALAEADVVLVVDSDVPWISAQSKPADAAAIYHLDSDPLKEGTTLWYLPCEKRWKCDSSVALRQLADVITRHPSFAVPGTKHRLASRTDSLRQRFAARQERLVRAEAPPENGTVTAPFFMARLRTATAAAGVRVVGLNESTTNLGSVADHLRHDAPLSLIGSGGGALGWYSGGAIGACMGLKVKVAEGGDDPLVVAFAGDGTWLFGVPSCAYWMARKYNTPFVTIIWNNGGWASPKNACLRIHPEVGETFGVRQNGSAAGVSQLSESMLTAIDPSPAFGKIAEGAGEAWWATVTSVFEVDKACEQAIRVVREEGRSAVVEVMIPKI